MKGSKDGKKFGPFNFPPDAKDAFDQLHKAFMSAPILAHFDPMLRIRVEIDASIMA